MEKKSSNYIQLASMSSLALLFLGACIESKELITDAKTVEADEDSTTVDLASHSDLALAPDLILNSSQWKEYRKYWHNMNEVDRSLDSTAWNYYHAYNNTMSEEKKIQLASDLDSCMVLLEEMKTDGLMDESVYNVLINLTNERHTYITEGYGYLFMTRMAPAPGTYDRVHLLEDLEARIDTLQDLRDKNLITEELKEKGLNLIQEDIEKFALTGFEDGRYFYNTSVVGIENKKDSTIFEQFYAKLQTNHNKTIDSMKENDLDPDQIKEAKKKHKNNMNSLSKLEAALPILRLLIEDLEN